MGMIGKDRRSFEEALLAEHSLTAFSDSASMMRTVMDSVSDFIFLKDKNSRVVMVNKAYCDVFSVDIGDIIGKDDYELYDDPVLAKEVIANDKCVIESGVTKIFEESVMTASGRKTYLLSKTPWRDDSGNVIGVVGVAHDITELKRQENELLAVTNELEEKNAILDRQSKLLDLSNEAIFAWALNGPIIYWNEGAAKLYGYRKEEAIGRFGHDLLKTKFAAELDEFKYLLDKNGEWFGELEHVTKDGRKIVVESRHQVILNDNGQKIVLETNRDITEKKSLQDELRRQKNLLEAIINNMNDGVVVFNNEGKIIFRNAEVLRMYPNVANSTEFEHFYDGLLCCDLEDNPIPKEKLPAMRALNGENIKNDRILVKYLDTDETRYVEINAVPVYDRGSLLSAVVTHHDITRLFEYQEALKESERSALELVDELKKADRNKNEFLSAISHELRNPLATIVSGLALIDVLDPHPKIRDTAEIIRHQTDHLRHLVDDLLDITRITNHKLQLRMETVDLNELALTVFSDHRILFHKKRIEARIRTEKVPLYVCADPTRITQIVRNLLDNSMKFTDAGGIVTLAVYARDSSAYIRVTDNGAGIDARFLPSLFEPFKQADSSLDSKNSGLGLGLSIVKGISELHGGTVGASSAGLGKGSQFTISLPIIRQ